MEFVCSLDASLTFSSWLVTKTRQRSFLSQSYATRAHLGKGVLQTILHAVGIRVPAGFDALWLFPNHGSVSFCESPERESCDEDCNQHQGSNQHTNNGEKRIVEKEDSGFQPIYDPYRWIEWDGGLRLIDHQHIAIACRIIPSSIAGIHNGRSKGCVCFLFDETSFFQVSADSISFQVHGRSNVMGGKMVGSAQLNPAIIGRRSNPDRLSIDERSGFPEANMPSVCNIVGGLFKSKILNSPKDGLLGPPRNFTTLSPKNKGQRKEQAGAGHR